jgi:hypothetical protein
MEKDVYQKALIQKLEELISALEKREVRLDERKIRLIGKELEIIVSDRNQVCRIFEKFYTLRTSVFNKVFLNRKIISNEILLASSYGLNFPKQKARRLMTLKILSIEFENGNFLKWMLNFKGGKNEKI